MLNAEELQYPSLSQGTSSPQEAYELEQASLFKALENTTNPLPTGSLPVFLPPQIKTLTFASSGAALHKAQEKTQIRFS